MLTLFETLQKKSVQRKMHFVGFYHCSNIDFILKLNYSLTQDVVEKGLVG